MPDCRRLLVVPGTGRDPAAPAVKIAHIAGNRPGAPRFDSGMSDEQRNSEDNLIAVCANCHDRIDGQPGTYTVSVLRVIKKRHEAWVPDETGNTMPRIGLSDIAPVVLHVMASEDEPVGPDAPLPPREKIAKNLLSPRSERMIRHGMMASGLVKRYINESSDARLAGRIKNSLGREYERCRSEGLRGDELFDAMVWFVGGTGDFAWDAAGLAVLVHFFESCEVFEK